VTAFLGLLQERAGDRLDGPLREYMSFASGAAGRMQRLIDDLLAYARLGRGDCRETVPADALLDEALAGVRLSLIETEAEVMREPLPEVNGNRTELALVFQNLIGNALKFRKGRKPRIHVRASREDRFWRFTISDNGIGIGPEHREKIFLIFERLPTEEPCEGSGMGLAICRKIVERHGGRIWVDSKPGLGSDFHFTIPVREGEGT
jgi:signal transduction histidine kinase